MENDTPQISMTAPDKIALQQFKRSINSRNSWDVDDQAHYNKEEKVWGVHRKDPKGQVVIDSYYFSTEDVANVAINYAKSMRK